MIIIGEKNGSPLGSWYAISSGFPEKHRYGSIVGFICEWDSAVPAIFADTDGDKLYDFYEINGMRIQNGSIVYTQPNNKDSDNDKLEDGEEINPILREKKIYNSMYGYNVSRYLVMKSDPTKEDTDGDGILDKDDP
ncbi:MAG: hypothetical protein LBM93_03395, partial [Oscillospiraceae bacterium]|jgi:hypothetical protein|nr:hypothetical protein [Oscillospiraceae bacterium]